MIFVRLGKLLAWTLLVLGVFRAGTAWYVAFAFTYPAALTAAQSRYVGPGTTGEAVDQGLMWISMGIVVGLFVQIADRKRT